MELKLKDFEKGDPMTASSFFHISEEVQEKLEAIQEEEVGSEGTITEVLRRVSYRISELFRDDPLQLNYQMAAFFVLGSWLEEGWDRTEKALFKHILNPAQA